MKVLAFDTETAPIRPGTLAPELACISWCDGENSGVVHNTDALDFIVPELEAACKGETTLVGHNVVYDMGVLVAHCPGLMEPIFDAYEAGCVWDTQIRQQLIDIATGEFKTLRNSKGSYSLAGLSKRHLNMVLDKDEWRMKYAELIDTPLEDWPEGAVNYARSDAEATHWVWRAQEQHRDLFPDQDAQVKAAWALHLMSCRGMRTDPGRVAVFAEATGEAVRVHGARLKEVGLMREKGTKDLAAIRKRISDTLGPDAPRTDKGAIKTSQDVLEECKDPDLVTLVEYNRAQKIQSTWMEYLELGTHTAIQPRFNTLVETGRTSCSKPNIQNPHRATGLRECFTPRDGYLYISCDYTALEMCTLAQVCIDLGFGSALGDAINAGLDPHLSVAAQLAHTSYEDALIQYQEGNKHIKNLRQTAKVLNFGLPGGLGARTFVKYAWGFGVDIDETQAYDLKNTWLAAWPEMADYFAHIGVLTQGDSGTLRQLRSNRIRGDVRYTQACNSYFQGLAADGAKAACYKVAQACYTDTQGPLYGSHPVAFIHDEIIMESPIDKAPEAAEEMAWLMCEIMQQYTPDVKIKAEPALMDRWYKDAETVRDGNGRLQVWQPTA